MPAVEQAFIPLPDEETQGGASMRLLTIHFGQEAGISFPPPSQIVGNTLFRWDPPLSLDDARGGIIGGRSAMWHPKRTRTSSIFGDEGRDFAGRTRHPEELGDIDEWQP